MSRIIPHIGWRRRWRCSLAETRTRPRGPPLLRFLPGWPARRAPPPRWSEPAGPCRWAPRSPHRCLVEFLCFPATPPVPGRGDDWRAVGGGGKKSLMLSIPPLAEMSMAESNQGKWLHWHLGQLNVEWHHQLTWFSWTRNWLSTWGHITAAIEYKGFFCSYWFFQQQPNWTYCFFCMIWIYGLFILLQCYEQLSVANYSVMFCMGVILYKMAN